MDGRDVPPIADHLSTARRDGRPHGMMAINVIVDHSVPVVEKSIGITKGIAGRERKIIVALYTQISICIIILSTKK